MIVDISQLTDNQQLGLEYALAKRNKELEQAFKPTEQVPEFVPKTQQEYIDDVVRSAADSWYNDYANIRAQKGIEGYYKLSPEQQAAARKLLGIPDGVAL